MMIPLDKGNAGYLVVPAPGRSVHVAVRAFVSFRNVGFYKTGFSNRPRTFPELFRRRRQADKR